MHRFRPQLVGLLLAGSISTTAVAAQTRPSPPASSEAPARLTLERLYTLPWLIGTAPSGFAWSPDSRRLAFLWNEDGFEHRDVWVVDLDDPELRPRRVTRLPAPRPEAADDEPVARAAAVERAERPSGATEVAWHPDSRHLTFVWQGDLFLAAPGEEPRRLTEAGATAREVRYSPDGRWLAWLAGGDLWRLPREGEVEPRRLTSTGGVDVAVSSYRWSPDSRRIALVEVDRRRVPMRSIPDYLTEEPELTRLRRAYPGEPSPESRLGIVEIDGTPDRNESNARRTEDDSAAGPPRVRWLDLGLDPQEPLHGYRWSPDGERLAIDASDLYAKDRRIVVVDVAAPDTPGRIVMRERDPGNVHSYYWQLEWTPTGDGLYFLSDRDRDFHVYRLDLAHREDGSGSGALGADLSMVGTENAPAPRRAGTASGDRATGDVAVTRLTRGDYAVASFTVVDGGLVIVANREHPEERNLFFVDEADGEPVKSSVRSGTHEPTVSPDGRWAAVHFSSDDTPPDLFLTALRPASMAEEKRERRVTDSPVDEFDRYRWVTPRYVTFPSHVDGTTLHGRLTLPPDFDPSLRYPAILGSVYTETVRNQWGGRTAHPTWGLDQYLAQEGFVLLNVDVRGSWGRGREHRRGIRLDYGGIDVEDLASGVHWLETLGFVDMERVGIWGSSYGGLMTAMSLFRKPELYAAGIAGAPATNVRHALTGQMEVMMEPADQPEEYDDSSPFLHAEGLEDPLMIIHGMRDWIVLFQDSVTLVQRLILLGKEVDFVVLPDAGHGWDAEGLAQTRFAFREMVDFFERHLGGPEPAEAE